VGASAASPPRSTAWRLWLAVATAAVALFARAAYWLTASRPALSFADRDWILIADTENRTGNPRFDKALLTALTVSIEQSHYANVVPRSRIYETLKRMNRSQDLSSEITINESLGREICLRESFRALLLTSLTRTGKEYLLIARLVDPKTGTSVREYTRKIQQDDAIIDALVALPGEYAASL
jgi:hypothetical protein